MNDEWKSYELERRRYPSTAFYETKPVKNGLTVWMSVLFVILTIVAVIVIYLLIKNRRKPCTAVPMAPSDVSAGSLSSTQFIVQWRGVDGAESYTVYVGAVTRFSVDNSVSIITTKNTRATITGLAVNKNYYIKVTATNSCGESSPSAEVTFVYLE